MPLLRTPRPARAHGAVAAALLLALAPLAPSAAQTVRVVDDDPGPGVDFTNLHAAQVASDDGDILLLRTGVYNSTGTNNKSLAIVADRGADVTVVGTVVIDFLGADQWLLLQGLRQVEFDFSDPGFLNMRDVLGHVWVEDCELRAATLTNAPGGSAWIRTTFDGSMSRALWLIDGHAVVLDSALHGGDGIVGHVDGKTGELLDGFTGGTALMLSGRSTAFVAGSSLTGGDGGNGFDDGATCSDGGDGGAAIETTDAAASVRLQSTSLALGTAGAATAPCVDGQDGQLVVGPVSPTPTPGRLPTLTSNSPVREGQSIVLEIDGEPGATAVVFYAFAQRHAVSDALRGALLLENPFVLTAIGLDAAGDGQLVLPVPAGAMTIDGLPVYFGTGFVSPSGAEQLGGSTAVVLLDDAF